MTVNFQPQCAWKPPGRSSRSCYQFSLYLSFKTRGRVSSSCVRSSVLHASETWPLTKPNLQRLQRNDRAMIRQICNVRPQDIVTTRSSELLAWLGFEDLDRILKDRRLRWYGQMERSNSAVSLSHTGWGKAWTWEAQDDMEAAERYCREWKLSAINSHDRHTWRPGVRSTMRAASQLSGKEKGGGGGGGVRASRHRYVRCPCPCTLIKNPIMIMMMIWCPDENLCKPILNRSSLAYNHSKRTVYCRLILIVISSVNV